MHGLRNGHGHREFGRVDAIEEVPKDMTDIVNNPAFNSSPEATEQMFEKAFLEAREKVVVFRLLPTQTLGIRNLVESG